MTDFERQLLFEKAKSDNKTKVLIALIYSLCIVLCVAILTTGYYVYRYIDSLVIEYETQEDIILDTGTGGNAMYIHGDGNNQNLNEKEDNNGEYKDKEKSEENY